MSQFVKHAGETVSIAVNFRDKLIQTVGTWGMTQCNVVTEFLTGTPTAEELFTADLTIANVTIITTGRLVSDGLINASEGVEFTVAGGTARTAYTIRVSTITDSSPYQTLVNDIRILIV